MPSVDPGSVGSRIAAGRKLKRLTQAELADQAYLSLSMVKQLETGKRQPSTSTLDAIGEALGIDPGRLAGTSERAASRIHDAIPALRACADAYDLPPDGPIRELAALRTATADLESLRLAARYTQLARNAPALIAELTRAMLTSSGTDRLAVARLLASAYRSADAAVYKYGYRDLSARLVELMRWAAASAEDPVLDAVASYVRMEVFFASRQDGNLATGLRMLEAAIDRAPATRSRAARAALGALHMRAAVVAGRMRDDGAAQVHLAAARKLADRVHEGVYLGTAFGPASFRVHEVAVAVELGDGPTALTAARTWKPPGDLPAERRSHYYIDVARAQLWQNLADDAEESLQVARRIAPQHVREHPQVHDTLRSLLRSQRTDRHTLLGFAEWAGVV